MTNSYSEEVILARNALTANRATDVVVNGVIFNVRFKETYTAPIFSERIDALHVVASLFKLGSSAAASAYMSNHAGTVVYVTVSNDPSDGVSVGSDIFPIIQLNTTDAIFYQYQDLNGNWVDFTIQRA